MSPYSQAPAYPAPGEVVDGKYHIERLLGQGGMGAVAKATHLLLRAPVALKFMNPDYIRFEGAVDRFLNEGIASRAIRSEHVVQVDDVGKLPSGAPYLVMDCLDGLDLSDLIKRDGHPGLGVERSVHLVLQILRGLQAAHASGIVHRDMKPSNCFVIHHEGEDDFVKILDFGISKVAQAGSASLTKTNSALGTPLYMSPEQARSPKDVDFRSDIYSVGVILYELLSGKTPFHSDTGEFTEILFKLFTAEIPPIQAAVPEVPTGLAKVVHRALAREVLDRYQSARDFAEGLIPFAGARSNALIGKIATWKPESQSFMPAGHTVPPSMVAFAALRARESRLPTQVLGAQAQHLETPETFENTIQVDEEHLMRPSEPPIVRVSALPVEILRSDPPPRRPSDAPPRPSEAPPPALRSQDLPLSPMVAASRTNLTAERDAIPPSLPSKKRSPLVYAIPVAGMLLVVGAGVALKARNGGDAAPVATGSTPAQILQPSALSTSTSTHALTVTTAASTFPPASASASSAASDPDAASAASSARTPPSATQAAPPTTVVTPPTSTKPSLHNTTLQP